MTDSDKEKKSRAASNNVEEVRDWLREVVDQAVFADTDPLLVSPRHIDRCFHHQFVLDSKTRTVSCKKCQRDFLPFDALAEVAQDWQSYAENRAALQADLVSLRDTRDALRKEVQSLKAKDRRLLKDAVLISGMIADWLEGVIARAEGADDDQKAIARSMARLVRNGEWQGKLGKP